MKALFYHNINADSFSAENMLIGGGGNMSQTTKWALAMSLQRVMAQKPLSKITIADITQDCGINRMTFYYHFQDIFDLIDWICQEEGAKAIQGRKGYETWQDGFIALCHAMIKNRAFVEGVYHSVQREQIENYLFRVVYDLLLDVVCELSEGYSISHENQRYITNFYKFGFVGVVLEWVKNGMNEAPEAMVERVSQMMHGQLLLAIQNMDSNSILSNKPH